MRVWRVALAIGLTLVAGDCAGGEVVHAKVCEDTRQHVRAADDECDRRRTDEVYRWRYYGGGIRIPAVGLKLPMKTGSYDEPDGGVVRIPAKGGTANGQR